MCSLEGLYSRNIESIPKTVTFIVNEQDNKFEKSVIILKICPAALSDSS